MAAFIPGFPLRRKKTFSESSDSGSTSEDINQNQTLTVGSAPTDGKNYLYDIDGKFAYSYYEKKPELYDIDGKHKYK